LGFFGAEPWGFGDEEGVEDEEDAGDKLDRDGHTPLERVGGGEDRVRREGAPETYESGELDNGSVAGHQHAALPGCGNLGHTGCGWDWDHCRVGRTYYMGETRVPAPTPRPPRRRPVVKYTKVASIVDQPKSSSQNVKGRAQTETSFSAKSRADWYAQRNSKESAHKPDGPSQRLGGCLIWWKETIEVEIVLK